MRVKKFVGTTMHEAIAQMREEFGRDAVILDTRLTRRRGILGLFGQKYVEVTAALDTRTSGRKGPMPSPGDNQVSSGTTKIANGKKRDPSLTPSAGQESSVSMPAQLAWRLYQDALKLEKVSGGKPAGEAASGSMMESWPEQVKELHRRLVDNGVEGRLAAAILQSVWQELTQEPMDAAKLLARTKERVAAMVRCVPPWDLSSSTPKVAALIGPTGVGKTTTLAKIAANYSLIAGADVGLITLDTYRIAAAEQLRVYSQIIGIPLRVATRPEEIEEAIQSWSDKDLILIDTAGSSPRDDERLEEMEAVLASIDGIERHLVFSATTSYRDLASMIRRFSDVGFDRLIATKLDETTCHGSLLTAYALARRPFSFLTDGQSVPECIRVAEAEHLSDLILGDA
ncbi:MAG: flagellar biosynthesis protein FlhF [Firmicutes bacterium]|nr:flagellar biosynthesis protein FlhF [Bacillota bacterium]